MVAETRLGAQSLGVELQILEVRQPAELATAFAAMTKAEAKGVLVLADPMFIAQRARIVELARSHRIPAMYHLRHFVEAGGLISYGAEYTEMFRQSADLIDKILKGAKPADLPVEQPWRYVLAINLKTAKALGLTIHRPCWRGRTRSSSRRARPTRPAPASSRRLLDSRPVFPN
jgi:putative tryptophan/tyrosine transport system substrate-binding protein